MYVAVVGPGQDASERDCDQAREVGRLLAERGIRVVTGGLTGVMAAAAEGCSQAGGISIGLLPGTDREAASPATDPRAADRSRRVAQWSPGP